MKQGDLIINQLGEILVRADDHSLHPLCRSLFCQGGDDIIGLHPGHDQKRQCLGTDQVMQRCNLACQIRRHGRAVGLVFGVQAVAETRLPGIENNGKMLRAQGVEKAPEHPDDRQHRSSRLPLAVFQRRRAVIAPKQAVAAVYQY